MIREKAGGAQEGRKLTGGENGPILFSMRRADEGFGAMLREAGAMIASMRKAEGLSQGELSGEAGIHLNTLWNLEKGLVAPSVSTMYRLYRALGILKVESSSGELRLKS